MSDMDIVKAAIRDVQELAEPYRVDAFRALLRRRLAGGSAEPEPARGSSRAAVGPPDGTLTFADFYQELTPEPNTYPERFAAVAYFRSERGEESVTQGEIIDTLRGAGIQPPKNFHRDVKNATSTKSALLMAAATLKEGRKAWQLTMTGRKFVEGLRDGG